MIGLAPFGVTQKREPVPQPGPPFAANSAFNGTSVDSVTGKIVLGNDQGDPAAPAQLFSNREIVTNSGFVTDWVDFPVPFGPNTRLRVFDQRVILDNLLTGATVFMELNGSSPQFQANAPLGNDSNYSLFNGLSGCTTQTNGITPYMGLSNPTTGVTDFRATLVLGVMRIRDNNGTGNGLNIDGTTNNVQSTGTLSTAQPSANGAGIWNLGKFVAGAVAPDAANYVEVMIDGIIRKLIVAV